MWYLCAHTKYTHSFRNKHNIFIVRLLMCILTFLQFHNAIVMSKHYNTDAQFNANANASVLVNEWLWVYMCICAIIFSFIV